MDVYNFISLLGIVILIAFAYLFSTNRREINWHVVIWGLGLQLLFAWFVFVFPVGIKVFSFINKAVVKLMNASLAGSEFVFGRLALPPGMNNGSGENPPGFILAFQAFPAIIFFSSLMAVLYYCNILPKLIKVFAFWFTKLMKVSGAESLCTAANIFVGVESSLTVRPYLKDMTRSELCTVLTAGMATVSSNVLAIYVFSLQKYFPAIAGHLISASIISAPAALMASKILLPETETPRTLGENISPVFEQDHSLFEAIINGANTGVRLIVGIVALLIAVLGLLALADQILGFVGGKLNMMLHLNISWSFKDFLGVIFYPFTVILGVPLNEAGTLARIIGERAVATEVVAYQDLASAISQGLIRDPRTVVVGTYALCGFAHLASLAIFVGGTSAIVPEKTSVLAQVGLRALLAATIACLLTACVAGLFFVNGSTVLRNVG